MVRCLNLATLISAFLRSHISEDADDVGFCTACNPVIYNIVQNPKFSATVSAL